MRQIMVVGADKEECRELCAHLQVLGFQATALESLPTLEKHVQDCRSGLVLLDLDSVAVDNLFLKRLKRQRPELNIVGMSKHSFHPELKESIANLIYAVLAKPIDPDELSFILRSVHESHSESEG